MTTTQIAQGLASLGRNGDSVLVHMQPQEVAGLQSLAEANGTTLTVNPQTGLPEAFSLGNFFKSLLPTLAGAGVGMVPGMQGLGYGIAAGALTGAALNKDDPLMGAVTGGMGGFGGSNLAASSLKTAGIDPSSMISGTAEVPSAGIVQGAGAADAFSNPGAMVNTAPAGSYTNAISEFGPTQPVVTGGGGLNLGRASPDATSALPQTTQTFGGNLSQAMSNIGDNPMDFVKNNAFGLGAPIAMAGLAGMEPPETMSSEEYERQQAEKFRRPLNLNYDTGLRLAVGGAIQSGGIMDLYQNSDSQPTSGDNANYGLGRLNNLSKQQSMANATQNNFARGGVPKLEDGGFVVPADVTFYLGNHNTEKGQQRLAQMYGGQPIKGPGTGLSDSIPTSIEGREPARIANGEVYIPRKAVMSHGGADKFYSMMDKVRKKATGSTKQAKSA
jgi:hypothetical protein